MLARQVLGTGPPQAPGEGAADPGRSDAVTGPVVETQAALDVVAAVEAARDVAHGGHEVHAAGKVAGGYDSPGGHT